MKKYLILFFIASLTLSCSSNSTDSNDIDDSVDASTKTPVSVQFTGQNIGLDLLVFTYNNNGKLLTAEDNSINYVQEYVYSGDRLTGIKNYTNNVLGSQDVYEYNNGLVSKMLSYNSNILTRTRTYTYSNGVVQSYADDYTNPIRVDEIWDYEYNQTDNSVKRTNRNSSQTYEITTYDQNKRPFYNLPSRKLLHKASGNTNSNNIVKIESYFNGSIVSTRTYANTYDSDNFLTSVSIMRNGTIDRTETYTYNQ
tara:strand:- start:385 stop:1143 length:759 start_codon:yes stop_codon:yes gene_type:complete